MLYMPLVEKTIPSMHSWTNWFTLAKNKSADVLYAGIHKLSYLLGNDNQLIVTDWKGFIETLAKRAMDHPEKIGLAYLGIPGNRLHFAFVSGLVTDPVIRHQQIKTILALSEPSARSPYELLTRMAGCSFMIADNSKSGLLRHKHFLKSIDLGTIRYEYQKKISDILKIYGYIYGQNEKSSQRKKNAERIFKGIYFKSMAGVEPTDQLLDVFQTIDESLSIIQLITPGFLHPFNRLERNTRAMATRACQQFIEARTDAIIHLFDRQVDSLLTETLRRILPTKTDWTSISKDEERFIGSHELLKSTLFSLFPINNAAHVAAKAVHYTLIALHQGHIDDLRHYLDEQPELNANELKPPFSNGLHHLYLQGLKQSKFTLLYRYTKTGIYTDELNIPPNTLIACNLSSSATLAEMKQPVTIADQADTSATPNVSRSTFSFFGVGTRKCPAEGAVNGVTKQLIIDTIKEYNRMSHMQSPS